uniref:GATOR complex protein NPRL3 n=1 Tax=Cacopsylla melanoneura TaxID=428564 RepID=A0A8D8M0J9_9HEMI
MEANPICILFVKSDSKGDRLLFRYPFNSEIGQVPSFTSHRRSPYSLTVAEDFYIAPENGKVHTDCLTSLSDEALSTLFAVKADLVDKKFELKINEVRFVGHPTLANATLINIVFALHAVARPSIVKCYYDMSKRLGKALKYEEEHFSYVSNEIRSLQQAHDIVLSSLEEGDKMSASGYELIMKQSDIALNIKKVYDELITSGLVYIKLNKNHQVSFCLPQKVHKLYCKGIMMEPELIDKCMKNLKPYHGLLLLTEPNRLLDSLYPDSSTPLIKLIKMYSPLKSIQILSTDTSLPLSEISSLIGSLVYWGKASVIFPLCSSNMYVVAPNASTHTNSSLIEKFMQAFPGHSLLHEISEFSLPISLKHRISPLSYPHEQKEIAQMIVWMLQHRILMQLHTYMFLVPASQHADQKTKFKQLPDELDDSPPLTFQAQVHSEGEKNMWNKLLTLAANEKMEAEILALESELQPVFRKLLPTVNQEDLKLFLHFFKQGYLKGTHHIEEIMYLENKTRAQICQLIDKLRQLIVTCDIEDSYISQFYPHVHNNSYTGPCNV